MPHHLMSHHFVLPSGLLWAEGDPLELPLSDLASIVWLDWDAPYFGAVPYLSAMESLETINGDFGEDSGRAIVTYFLSNASTWRGPIARAVKAELRARLARR